MNREEFQFSQYATICQTSTRYHYIVTFVKRSTLLQQITPCSTSTHIHIAFIIVEQLECTFFCQLGNSEMRIIFRVFQRLDRLVSSDKSTSLSLSRSRCFEIHINNAIRFADHLNLTSHFINTWRDTQTTSHRHEEDVTAMCIGYTCLPYTGRRNRRATQVAVLVYLNIFRHPYRKFVPICLESSLVFFRNSLFEEWLVRSQHFISHTRITDETTEIIHVFLIYMWLHVVNQNIQTYITQVLGRDTLQHIDTTSLRLVRTETSKEVGDNIVVTTRSHKNLSHCIFIQLILLGKFTCRFISHESCYVCITDWIFNSKTTVIFSTLFRCHFRHVVSFYRRNNVHFYRIGFAGLLVQFHLDFIILTEWQLAITELTVLRCPYQHVTLTSRQECLTFSISLLGCYCIEFSIVIYLEFYLCICYRLTCCIYNLYWSTSARSIIADDIDFCVVRILMHDFFRTIVTAEHLGMHQHTTVCRSIEPTEIQDRFRFASTQEIPSTVYPCFYPCMVVIGMCPTRSIYLTSRNTNRTQSRYSESRLFTTTSISSLHRSQWRTCTSIRRCIDHLFMTPVVYFQYGIMQRKILHTVLQFFIEHLTAMVQIFIVYTNRKYEMTEFTFRNQLTPRHFFLCLQGIVDVFQKEFTWIVGDVPQRHVSIKESQCFTLLFTHFLFKHFEQITLIPCSGTLLEVSLNDSTFCLITNQMIVSTRECRKHQCHTQRTNG